MDQSTNSGMPVQQMETSNAKYWLIAGAIVVLAVGAWMLLRSNSADDLSNIQNSITVTDQDANSVSIVIDSASLNVSGFVVIHEDASGAPGAIVSQSKLLTAGTHINETIIMTTTPGAYYWAMLHADDGNSIFNAGTDLPLKDAAGAPVMARFQVKSAGLLNGEVDIKG